MRIIIFGNSGSGKSSLARRLSDGKGIAHLDLDEVAWQKDLATTRLPVDESVELIDAFTAANPNWVIEGCYASLIEYVAEQATKLYFMNLPVQECVENCRNRPWEPHKYASKAEQDENLDMLIDWVQDYFEREDEFSYASHRRIFERFGGEKVELRSNQAARQELAPHA